MIWIQCHVTFSTVQTFQIRHLEQHRPTMYHGYRYPEVDSSYSVLSHFLIVILDLEPAVMKSNPQSLNESSKIE